MDGALPPVVVGVAIASSDAGRAGVGVALVVSAAGRLADGRNLTTKDRIVSIIH